LKEFNDNKEMNFTDLVGNMKTHKMEHKIRRNVTYQRRQMSLSKPLKVDTRIRKRMMRTQMKLKMKKTSPNL